MIDAISLPKGWRWTTIGETADVVTKGSSPGWQGFEYQESGIPFVRSQNIRWGYLDVSELAFLPSGFNESHRKSIIQEGDVLLNLVGASVGRAAVATSEVNGANLNQAVAIIRVKKSVMVNKLLVFLLLSPQIQKHITTTKSDVARANFNLDDVRPTRIPLPPLEEQRRIVAKIEELLSDLDAGVAALERAKANLKRYRAAVLKAAVEGKLTEAWRAEHPNTEPASKLLKRILTERRQKWEADQLAKFAAAGKAPPKNWRAAYANPSRPDLSEVNALPNHWCWASIEEVSECLDHFRVPVNKSDRQKRTGNIPYYGANGLVGWIDDFLFDEPLVLVVEDETFIGREKPFSYKIMGKAWVNNHAHILRASGAISVDLLNFILMRYPFIPLTTGTTARRKLTKAKLMVAPVPLPPLDEQLRITDEVAESLSQADAADLIVEKALDRVSCLRQSILKRAFEGQLPDRGRATGY